jgi:hypothetical protein
VGPETTPRSEERAASKDQPAPRQLHGLVSSPVSSFLLGLQGTLGNAVVTELVRDRAPSTYRAGPMAPPWAFSANRWGRRCPRA